MNDMNKQELYKASAGYLREIRNKYPATLSLGTKELKSLMLELDVVVRTGISILYTHADINLKDGMVRTANRYTELQYELQKEYSNILEELLLKAMEELNV